MVSLGAGAHDVCAETQEQAERAAFAWCQEEKAEGDVTAVASTLRATTEKQSLTLGGGPLQNCKRQKTQQRGVTKYEEKQKI